MRYTNLIKYFEYPIFHPDNCIKSYFLVAQYILEKI